MMFKFMRKAEVSSQEQDAQGRFKRPVALAVLGSVCCVGGVAMMAVKAGVNLDSSSVYGLVAFALFGVFASVAYSFIGARYSVRLANRLLEIVGGIVLLVLLAFLVIIIVTS
jgi:hypothetical protein